MNRLLIFYIPGHDTVSPLHLELQTKDGITHAVMSENALLFTKLGDALTDELMRYFANKENADATAANINSKC